MKLKSIYLTGMLAVASVFANLSTAHAGGNTGQMIAKFEPAKSAEQVQLLSEGDTIVKVCRACRNVTLVRVEKPGKGLYDVVARKCEDCGSDDTYVAITNQDVPFKERIKR